MLAAAVALPVGSAFAVLVGLVLVGVVFAAVHHDEVVAHRTGEPFGTLVLAVAVTVIEALIPSLMLESPAETVSLARDTAFAAVMIVCNGIVGACLLLGGVRHFEQGFQFRGALAALAVLAALTVLVLIMPNHTTSAPGPLLAPSQLVFAGVVSLLLYGAFVFVQTVRHRDYFLPQAAGRSRRGGACRAAIRANRRVELRAPPAVAGGGRRARQVAVADSRGRRRRRRARRERWSGSRSPRWC